MNENNTIPFIQSSSSDGTGASLKTKEQLLKNYVSLVNRISTRLAQEKNDTKTFDSLSLSGVP
jgi:hypothetical protein